MYESIHKYFQVGALQWMSFPNSRPIDSLYNLATDDFFDVVEVSGYTSEAEKEQAQKILRQSHMKVCYGAQPKQLSLALNPNALDEGERCRAEEELIRSLEEAHDLGADGISFLAGKWEKETQEKAYAQLLKTTGNLCAYAASKRMSVELEVFDYDMDKAVLMGPAPYVAKFAADMRSAYQNFGVLVDLSHIPTTYETSKFVVRTLRPYITHFHIGNAVIKNGCDGYGDKHPRFGYPNSENDTEELRDFFQVLKEEGFFDPACPYILSIEVTPRPGEDEAITLTNTKRVINRAWSLLE